MSLLGYKFFGKMSWRQRSIFDWNWLSFVSWLSNICFWQQSFDRLDKKRNCYNTYLVEWHLLEATFARMTFARSRPEREKQKERWLYWQPILELNQVSSCWTNFFLEDCKSFLCFLINKLLLLEHFINWTLKALPS